MKYYRFKTRTSIYFPEISVKEHEFIYTLYGNYGGKATRAYWWMFRHCAPFRKLLCATDSSSIEDFEIISQLVGKDKVFGLAMGTAGLEQKKSILGYDKKTGQKFFAKFATKEGAKKLSRNVIAVYKFMSESGLVPKLYDSKETDEYVYLKCECIDGEHYSGFLPEEELLLILSVLRGYHYPPQKMESREDGLQTCFAHNDFCLWNMLNSNGKTRIIDWEMACEYPLGHDLFTYIFQTTFFVWNSISTEEVYKTNLHLIKKYFGSIDFIPYLKHFIECKIKFFENNPNGYATRRYTELKEFVNTL